MFFLRSSGENCPPVAVICVDIRYSSVNLVIRSTSYTSATGINREVSKEAVTEWCDMIQTALSKMVLTRTCSNVSFTAEPSTLSCAVY